MFRYKFVMPGAANLSAGDVPANPPNWPDADRNDKHFVFAHGYNVNDTQSKGWGGEAFKRLFWSGSNARFTAFGWYGYQGQTFGITPDYQVNLDNAFATAKSFKQFLDLLEGEKTVAGHSMGNVLVGSAMHDWGARPKNYFMLNAAAAKECYDPAEADEPAQDAVIRKNFAPANGTDCFRQQHGPALTGAGSSHGEGVLPMSSKTAGRPTFTTSIHRVRKC